MRKAHLIVATISLIGSNLLLFGCGQSVAQFTRITAELVLTEEENVEDGTPIPYGSTIYHWANGITEVYGSDNNRIFIARDSEATEIPTPAGALAPATHVLQVPSGSLINEDEEDSNITRVYLSGSVILTIVDKSEDF